MLYDADITKAEYNNITGDMKIYFTPRYKEFGDWEEMGSYMAQFKMVFGNKYALMDIEKQ